VPPQIPASAPVTASHAGNIENTPVTTAAAAERDNDPVLSANPVTTAAAAERDNDPVLSANELRRRQRAGLQVSVRSVRQPAELPARASSHISRLFGNIILIVLIICICILLVRRLYMIAVLL